VPLHSLIEAYRLSEELIASIYRAKASNDTLSRRQYSSDSLPRKSQILHKSNDLGDRVCASRSTRGHYGSTVSIFYVLFEEIRERG
jgi:cyclopropane fatty-acyl-phospholipid synthase-like methyltransferase